MRLRPIRDQIRTSLLLGHTWKSCRMERRPKTSAASLSTEAVESLREARRKDQEKATPRGPKATFCPKDNIITGIENTKVCPLPSLEPPLSHHLEECGPYLLTKILCHSLSGSSKNPWEEIQGALRAHLTTHQRTSWA